MQLPCGKSKAANIVRIIKTQTLDRLLFEKKSYIVSQYFAFEHFEKNTWSHLIITAFSWL